MLKYSFGQNQSIMPLKTFVLSETKHIQSIARNLYPNFEQKLNNNRVQYSLFSFCFYRKNTRQNFEVGYVKIFFRPKSVNYATKNLCIIRNQANSVDC